MGRRVIFDLEADGLLSAATRIHCLCYRWEDEETVKVITESNRMRLFFEQENVTFVGHNIITYDLPVAQKILGVNVHYLKCVDTLPLSWNLYEHRMLHGLDAWGKDFGIEKPKVDDWENLTVEEYVHRCTEDVKINMRVWETEKALLESLYDADQEKIQKLVNYLGFKMDCIREQELPECGLTLDMMRVTSGIDRLTGLSEAKVEKLKTVMPKIPKYKKKKKPVRYLNKKGELTKAGLEWQAFLEEKKLSADYEGEVEYVGSYEEPNPNSVSQKKDWLYSLGWKPENIKFVRNKDTNEVSQIPQIVDKDDKTQVCRSVKKLFPIEPNLEELNGLGIINHRLGILKGFRDGQVEGKVYPGASAITSTMRLKHRTVVNLPAYNAPYAEEIRSSIIAPPGHVLIGADLVAGEDRTKRHLIFPYDPDYVLEQSTPGFDPHIDIAILAGLMTTEEGEFFKVIDAMEDRGDVSPEDIKKYKDLKDRRYKAKTTNFSATYGVGVKTLARNLNVSEVEAKRILDAYWLRNKSVLEYCENCQVKEVDGRMWILNEVSGHWLPLRQDKDRLSATNQSLLAFVFDTWLAFVRKAKVKVAFQYHDEMLLVVPEEDVERVKGIIKSAMDKTNNLLKLNVEMGCSIQIGQNYAETH